MTRCLSKERVVLVVEEASCRGRESERGIERERKRD